MRYITEIVILILSLFIFVSCFKDDSNTDIKKMNSVSIGELEGEDQLNPVKWLIGTRIQVTPELRFNVKEHNNLSYAWTVALDTISTERNLDVVLDAKPGNKVSVAYHVRDNNTGVTYIKQLYAKIGSRFSTGWLFLCEDNNGNGQLNAIDGQDVFIPNIYKTMNDEDLGSDPQCLRLHFRSPFDRTNSNYLNIACKGGPNKSVEVNGLSMVKEANNHEEFIDKTPPANFAPTVVEYCSNGHMIISNGKCYSRVGRSLAFITGQFDNAPLNVRNSFGGNQNKFPLKDDYELTDWACNVTCPDFGSSVIFFDRKNSAYMLCDAKELYELPSQLDTLKAFNPNNINGELIAGARTHIYSYGSYIGDFFTLIKRTDNYYIQRFCYNSYIRPGSAGIPFHAMEDKVFQGSEDLDDESVVVFAKSPSGHYMYYSTKDNIVKIYNYKSGTIRDMQLSHSPSGKITAMALSEDEKTLVIGYNNNGVGDIYFVSTHFIDEGTNKRDPILGKMGKPVDILQKVDKRNMWY